MRILRIVRTVVAVAVGVGMLWLTPYAGLPTALATTCPTQHNNYIRQDFFSAYNHDGAQTTIQIRGMYTPDWLLGGYAASTLWFGTDGTYWLSSPAYWVEVGVTQGFDHQNILVYYSAHQSPSKAYIQRSFSMAVTPGDDVTFKIIQTDTGDMKPSVTDTDTGDQTSRLYSDHSPAFLSWGIGAEYTCTGLAGSQVDKVYTQSNQYRKQSDGSWHSADYENAHDFNEIPGDDPNVSAAWCNEPVTFRYWVRSSIPTTGCN